MKSIIEAFEEIQNEQNLFSHKVTVNRTRAIFFLIVNGVTLETHIFIGENVKTIEFSTVNHGKDTRKIIKFAYDSNNSEEFKIELRKFFKKIKFSNLYGDKEEFWFESMKRDGCLRNVKYNEAKLKSKLNEIFNVKTTHERESALLLRVVGKEGNDIVLYERENIMTKIKLMEIC
jgi:hypothetical protein